MVSMLSSFLSTCSSSTRPNESTPAAIKGASTATSVWSTLKTLQLTSCWILSSQSQGLVFSGALTADDHAYVSTNKVVLVGALLSLKDSAKHKISNAACVESHAHSELSGEHQNT